MFSMCSFPDGRLKSIHWIWETLHPVWQVIRVFSQDVFGTTVLISRARRSLLAWLGCWHCDRALGCSLIVKLSVKMTRRHSSTQREVLLWQVVWRNKLSVEYDAHTHSVTSGTPLSVVFTSVSLNLRHLIQDLPSNLLSENSLPFHFFLCLFLHLSQIWISAFCDYIFQHHLPACLTTAWRFSAERFETLYNQCWTQLLITMESFQHLEMTCSKPTQLKNSAQTPSHRASISDQKANRAIIISRPHFSSRGVFVSDGRVQTTGRKSGCDANNCTLLSAEPLPPRGRCCSSGVKNAAASRTQSRS